MSMLRDRYVLIAIAAVLIVSAVCLTDAVEEPATDTEITGIVSDVRKTQNGVTVLVTDSSGTATKCFSPEDIAGGSVCSVSGRFSDDGNILFASRVTIR
jgi:DNA polymerase II small subunit/DNA polymerase delta subunit B